MRTTIVVGLALISAAFNFAHAQATATSGSALDSVTTVNELLKRENDQLRRPKVDAAAMKAAPAHVAPRPMDLQVSSIYGSPSSLRADLLIDGVDMQGVARGSRVQSCVVVEIANKCVKLAPATKGASCASACWTGEVSRPVMSSMPGIPSGVPTGLIPMPAPLPVGSGR